MVRSSPATAFPWRSGQRVTLKPPGGAVVGVGRRTRVGTGVGEGAAVGMGVGVGVGVRVGDGVGVGVAVGMAVGKGGGVGVTVGDGVGVGAGPDVAVGMGVGVRLDKAASVACTRFSTSSRHRTAGSSVGGAVMVGLAGVGVGARAAGMSVPVAPEGGALGVASARPAVGRGVAGAGWLRLSLASPLQAASVASATSAQTNTAAGRSGILTDFVGGSFFIG